MAKKDYTNWDRNELIKEIDQLRKRKKYGLVWEDKPENVVDQCKTELPVLEEVKDREIITEPDKPVNLLIEGDNYHALSVLNYTHKGKIDVIYIDPPYNTGNKDFIYNDQYVDKEDSYRHSKWLSFMVRRLKLAKSLLKPDGVIFISIDDNEEAQLRLLCDEIFGEDNFLLPYYVQVRYPGKTLVEDADVQKVVERVLVYGKSFQSSLNKQEIDYSFDKFIWEIKELNKPKSLSLGNKKVEIFGNDDYEIIKSVPTQNKLKEIWATGKVLDGNSSGRFFRDYLQGRYKDDGYRVLYKVYGIGDDQFDYRYFTGPKKDGATKGKYYQGVPNQVLDNAGKRQRYVPIVNFENFADSFGNCRQEGNIDFRSGKKPIIFLKQLLQMGLKTENGLVLDFFAGSGSLGHAILDINETQNTNHKFILCTNNENNNGNGKVAENICYPRINNVINGYNNKSGLGGNLKYFKTSFVPADPTDKNKTTLTQKVTEMLCIKEDTFEEVKITNQYKIFHNKNRYTGIVFDHQSIDDFKQDIAKIDGRFSVYVFSLGEDSFEEEFEDIKKKVKLSPIPEAILRVYRRIFK